ncbi:hypothetical protein JD77_00901 [Micromonospora olivasterospora]|uniref:Uncharacterized protein n=1 Tax=Micromonospora olivasterospora TaxID=1880 RepID=A0A562I5B7_MICOL|nr:hypothetical protein JD77_00901 [Micromonospora olivasterospora]
MARGLAYQGLRGRVARGGRAGHVGHGEPAGLGQPGGERRRPSGLGGGQGVPDQGVVPAVRLQAAALAAPAQRAVLVAEAQVGDAARAAGGAPVQRPAEHRAAADGGAELEVEEVVEGAAGAGVLLAERHHVRVVVDQHRTAQLGGEHVADAEPVPAGQGRRRHRGQVCVGVDRCDSGHGVGAWNEYHSSDFSTRGRSVRPVLCREVFFGAAQSNGATDEIGLVVQFISMYGRFGCTHIGQP